MKLDGKILGLAVLAASMIFVCSGCGDDNTTPPTTDTPQSLTDEGWGLFEAADWAAAAAKFEAALALDVTFGEAHNGLGWARLNLDTLDDAIASLDEALAQGVATAEPHAGQAIGYRELEPEELRLVLARADFSPASFEFAIEAADSALGRAPAFVFSHDDTFDHMDVRLIKAQSLFAIGEYEDANAEVVLLGGTAQDPMSETFVEDLLAEIERLGEEIIEP